MSYHMPGPGELNQRLRLREWSDIPNASNGLDQSESAGRKLWGKMECVGAQMFWGSMQTGEGITHRAYVWRVPGTEPEAFTGRHVIEHAGFRYRVMRSIDVNGERVMTAVELKVLGPI